MTIDASNWVDVLGGVAARLLGEVWSLVQHHGEAAAFRYAIDRTGHTLAIALDALPASVVGPELDAAARAACDATARAMGLSADHAQALLVATAGYMTDIEAGRVAKLAKHAADELAKLPPNVAIDT